MGNNLHDSQELIVVLIKLLGTLTFHFVFITNDINILHAFPAHIFMRKGSRYLLS